MRAAKVQASLRIRAVSPEPPLLAHTSSESRGTFRQKARSLAPLNGWACAVKICHDGMLEDTNSLGGAHMCVKKINSYRYGFSGSNLELRDGWVHSNTVCHIKSACVPYAFNIHSVSIMHAFYTFYFIFLFVLLKFSHLLFYFILHCVSLFNILSVILLLYKTGWLNYQKKLVLKKLFKECILIVVCYFI